MGIIRDNNPAIYDSLNVDAERAKGDAITEAQMAASSAAAAFKKKIWITAGIIMGIILVIVFFLAESEHQVWATLFFIGGGAGAIYKIKTGYEELGALLRKNTDFVTKLNNYR